ncbi:hypothetical protein C8Q80DRAFT_1107153 [Daedaleopsis nitida]|nr:hypothetical protein C8Q80DRAFT_1107153 [Daedaleopsis nitida]
MTAQNGPTQAMLTEDRICPGCKRSVVDENGGVVVAFGQSFFHVDCFKCAKCENQVTADTNLLLLSDGSPICANCSYSCNVCKQPILDEAIMTGDDSYHAHCFKCKVCKNRIDELVFAKTSKGIYCMDCHNERVARSQRHQQARKQEKERAAQAAANSGRGGSVNGRQGDSREGQNGRPSSGMFIGLPSSPSITRHPSNNGRPSTAGSSAASSPIDHFRSTTSPSSRMETLSVPHGADNALNKRKSFDAGIRPLNLLRSVASSASLNMQNGAPTEFDRSLSNATPPVSRGRASSRPHSPLQDYFDSYADDPNSYNDNEYAGSPISPPNGRAGYEDQRIAALGRARSASSSAYMTESAHSRTTPPRPTLNLDRMPTRSSTQRAPWDERHRASPDLVRQSALSGVEFELQRPGSASSVPPSPSHFVDVPHNIESGTDTEAESENDSQDDTHDRPPSLPPKEPPRRFERPSDLRVDVSSRSHTPANAGESEGTPESSPVERTSRATFITPALPPIRISMGGSDFSEFSGYWGQWTTRTARARRALRRKTAESSSSTSRSRRPTRRARRRLRRATSLCPSSSSSHEYMNGSRRSGERERARIDPGARSGSPPLSLARRHMRVNSNAGRVNGAARITVTAPGDGVEALRRKLQEAVISASERGAAQVALDANFVQSIINMLEQQQNEYQDLRRNLDGMKRASKQYIDGLTVAQTEYDRELKARRDAEAEVTRLRVLLSGQAVRLTAITGDSKRQEAQKQLARELSDQMSSLERDLSKLKVERDMTMAEVEQLSASRSSSSAVDGEEGGASLTRALSMRFDNIKVQYQHELVPLNEQREILTREIAELKASRDAFLEETTVLNRRNEELAQLNGQYQRRLEAAGTATDKDENVLQERQTNSFDRARSPPMLNASVSSTTLALSEDSSDTKFVKISKPDVQETHAQSGRPRFIKWPGSKAPKENVGVANMNLGSVTNLNAFAIGADSSKPKARTEHVFHQISVLRVARCDHCGDKMWGSQLRCSNCSIAVHTRCIHNVSLTCSQQQPVREDSQAPLAPLPPSMFGRDLVEQVRADSKDEHRMVPVIVEKCIDAVDNIALEYEGIYRKTGGSGQTKMITQLFERGDYASFDLRDSDRFNDICSVTSVLKSYFRGLPNPLLTFALHDKFIGASTIRDLTIKANTLTELVRELPAEHYYTLRALMLHLYRCVCFSERNLMHARNLGVVFGPTLMRSPDPGAEFSDMAGKALCIEWLVENAPRIFESQLPQHDD